MKKNNGIFINMIIIISTLLHYTLGNPRLILFYCFLL